MSEIKLITKESDYKEDKIDYKKFIVNPSKISKGLDDYLSGNVQQGYGTGIPLIDRYYLSKINEFYLLTGKKGAGKTTVNQALQVMVTIPNDLIWVVAFQENKDWTMKLSYMNYILGQKAKDVKYSNPILFQRASDWVDEHFIFIDVDDIKTAMAVAKGLIDDGVDVHALLLDPINSFANGFQDTGNGYADGVVAAREVLKFVNEVCSAHISQHPNMNGQRQEGAVTGSQGEGGWYYNKADFTYVIHREKGTNENEIRVEDVRNRHTGCKPTDTENPLVFHWSSTKIDASLADGNEMQKDVIGHLVRKYNPLNFKYTESDLPTVDPIDAF